MWRFITALLASLLVSTASHATLPYEGRTWRQVRTERFEVLGTTTGTRLVTVATEFERFHGFLDGLIERNAPQATKDTVVLLLTPSSLFMPYSRRDVAGRPQDIAGYFISTLVADFIVIHADPGSSYRHAVYHEYTHHLLERFGDLPLWAEEGLAEHFATVLFDDDQVRVGGPIAPYLDTLASERWLSLEQLVNVFGSSAEYEESTRASRFYAQSWLLVDYVLSGAGERALSPPQLLGLAGTDRPLHVELLEHLGLDALELETRLKAYAAGKAMRSTVYPAPRPAAEIRLEAVEVTPDVPATRLGQLLLLAHDDAPAAVEHLRRAHAARAKRPEIAAGLAFGLARGGVHEESSTMFDLATALDPDNRTTTLLRAVSLLQTFDRGVSSFMAIPDRPPSMVLEARALFRSVLDSAPDDLEALLGLGRTYAYSDGEDLTPGIAALDRARTISGGRFGLLLVMAQLYNLAGDEQRAHEIFTVVERKATDPSVLRDTRRQMLLVRQNRATRLFEQGRREEAVQMMDAVLADVDDPKLSKTMRRSRDEMLQRQGLIEREEQARRLTEEGRHDEAIEILDALIAEVGDPAATEQLRLNRANLERVVGLEQTRRRVQRLAEQRRFDEALRVMDELIASIDDPEVAARIRLDRDGLQQVATHNRCVEEYNRAVALYNDRRPREARSAVEPLLESCSATELSDAIRTFYKQVLRAN